QSCLLCHLRLPTLPFTPIQSQAESSGEPMRRYLTETPPVPQDEDEHEPMFVQAHDHDYMPEPSNLEEDPEEYEDDETEDGPVDYPMDGGDDGDDDDSDSSRDDAHDEDEDDKHEDDKDEEDKHI
ncbi:hypothetical protein Tco_1253457, partial [Tanacetum coccineum]